ncbi:hypothetical protein COTS27_00132 [Spirochaetota bacterium]|nr:hypothetical protein COTS27_00132 [Spirochaetota bacterium]
MTRPARESSHSARKKTSRPQTDEHRSPHHSKEGHHHSSNHRSKHTIAFIKRYYAIIATSALGLASIFFFYGTQANLSGMSLLETFLAATIVYAVPAQLILADQAIIRGSVLSIFIAVLLVNMRLLPMTMAVIPKIKSRFMPLNIINAHFIALTTWLGFLQLDPELDNYPVINKAHFYFGLGVSLWTIAWIMAVLGYLSQGVVSTEVQLAFVYANPLYFLLLILGQTRNKQNFLPIILGGLLLPFLALLSLQWSVILSGLIGGTVAFFINTYRTKQNTDAHHTHLKQRK